MAFPNLLKRLFASNGAGITLRGDIMPYGTAAPKAHGTAAAGSAETLSRSDHVHPLQTTVSGNAGSATKLAAKRTIDGVSFDGSANIHHYGTCSTAAGTAAKTVTLANFVLATGAIAFIRFTVTNTASSPTLNINSTGAKAIRYRNETISAGHLAANRTYCFIYDGSYYQLVGDIDTNTTYTAASAAPKAPGTAAVGTSTKYAREDHVHPLQTTVSGNAGSATKLATKRTIDGVNFDGSANIHHYGTCSTAADTEAKTVALANFVLATGAIAFIRFTVTNTASSPTLNINATGAKAIRYRNAGINASHLAADRTYCFIYDGSYYQLVGDIDTNTKYTAASAAPKAPGTAAVGTSTKYAREDHVHPLQTTVSGNAGSATKLAAKRTIDGVSFDGSANIHHYGTCSTDAGTAAKTVTLANFVLATGAEVTVRFTVTNTASNPTLNVNGTGAKAIQYRNAAISAGYLAANRTYRFVYDGSSYELVGDVDTNTTYTAASATPKAPGTAAVGTSTKYAREDHVHPSQTFSAFPTGTQMLFVQAAAPTGWTKQTTVNDAAIRVVSGTTGGGTGGTTAFSTAFVSNKSISLSGNVGATTLSVNQMPSHTHSYSQITSWRGWNGRDDGNDSKPPVSGATGAAGGSQSHTHSLSGTATVSLAVKYVDVILCKKD